MSARLSGRSSGKFPRMARRSGCWRAASTASSLALGSHEVGGWMSAASTPASSISFRRSSFEKLVTWRWLGLPGLPLAQMWTCASTISMGISSGAIRAQAVQRPAATDYYEQPACDGLRALSASREEERLGDREVLLRSGVSLVLPDRAVGAA